jgi:multidrug efflux pump subunit AcrA (membrane-fusion protein)
VAEVDRTIGPVTMKLFRDEASVSKSVHLEGKVQLALPVSVRVSGLVCAVVVVAVLVFASTASFTRKETLRGWLDFSAGVSTVSGPTGTYITAVGAQQGDWVRAGQALAWVDASRTGGAGFTSGISTSSAIVTAPVSGQVVGAEARVGQAVAPNASLFIIAPAGTKLKARLVAPTRASGFMSVGQDVRLLIDAYPFQRFGAVSGRITQISGAVVTGAQIEAPFPTREAGYVVDVELPDQTIGAYGRAMPLANGMLLNADVVIDKRSLMEWVLDPLFATGRRQIS